MDELVNIGIRQLRHFIVVAETGGFTRAAAKLHIAQPALSREIRRLESQLGIILFKREARGVALTSEGQQLLESAKATLREYDALVARAASFRQLSGGRLRVGFMAQGPGELLPAALRAFKATHPNAEISLHQFGFDDCFMGVTRQLTDVGFCIGPPDDNDDVHVYELFQEAVVVAMPVDHPLANRSRLSIAEIISEALFTDTHPPGRWRDYWDVLEHRNGDQPIIAGRFATHDEWLEAMRLGGGIALCPESTPRYYPRSGLAFVPLHGMAPLGHNIVWLDNAANPLIEQFVNTTIQAAGGTYA